MRANIAYFNAHIVYEWWEASWRLALDIQSLNCEGVGVVCSAPAYKLMHVNTAAAFYIQMLRSILKLITYPS